MRNIPLWKPLVILAVLVLCVLALYPPKQRLRLGLDLAGGTTLVYEVDVPEGQSAKDVVEQVIAVQQQRVDPTGVRNLVWRAQAGNRIEIQMALPSAETKQRRAAFIEAREQLLAGNLSRQQLDGALRAAPEQRAAIFARLAGDDEMRLELMQQAAQASDKLAAAEAPYRQAQETYRTAEANLRSLPADAPAEQRTEAESQLATQRQQLVQATRQFIDARNALNQVRDQLLDTNVDPREIERVLALSTEAPASAGGTQPKSARDAAVDQLVERHPDRASDIRQLFDAYAAYEQFKGPLDDPNDLIALLKGSGVLEFRIAASSTDVPNLSEYREQLAQRGPRAGSDRDYRWFKIDDISSFADRVRDVEALHADPQGYFAARGMVGQEYGGEYYLLLSNRPESSLTQEQEGWQLSSAHRDMDQSGYPAVGFELNTIGATLMGDLTARHKGRPMAIVLDNEVMSAPTIQGHITNRGVITGGAGGFSQEELDYLLRTLNAGSLQARMGEAPISITTTGPQFGQDNLDAGLRAAWWSLGLVSAFMLVYYFTWGVAANFALYANLIIVLGVMAAMEATFTLPGIAGMILTIGMAVDANVLIFERIREELQRGVNLPTAVRLGFDKALSSIIDSNMTTLVTCMVLAYTATADVKGFAVTLGIGLVANVFTAVFCSRVLIDLYLAFAKPKSMLMLPMVWPGLQRMLSPNFDWLGNKWKFASVSIVLGIAGIVAFVARGGEMYDIEFRSGTQVAFKLAPGNSLTLAEVRTRLDQAAQEHDVPELSGSAAGVVTVGDVEEGARATQFSISTLEQDASKVSDAIKDAFEDVLNVQRPIRFVGADVEEVSSAPVFPIRQTSLGEVINRPTLTEDVSEYIGGIAIVLDDLTPAASVDDIRGRIERMRMQPSFEGLGFRQFSVVGLDIAPSSDPSGPTLYESVVVVTQDNVTNYAESPDTFTDRDGLAATEWNLVHEALLRDTSLDSVSNFSSQVSNTMRDQAIAAIVLSWFFMLIYIAFRFGSLRYGFGAIVALIHDVVIALGLLALASYLAETPLGHALLLSDFRINLAVIAAAMTLIGYSVNDTIVIFDRIRENRGRLSQLTPALINDSVNQTFSRTILTAGTTFISLFVLYMIGGEGVHGFAFVMVVGSIVGVYSTVAIASPILLAYARREAQQQESQNAATPQKG